MVELDCRFAAAPVIRRDHLRLLLLTEAGRGTEPPPGQIGGVLIAGCRAFGQDAGFVPEG